MDSSLINGSTSQEIAMSCEFIFTSRSGKMQFEITACKAVVERAVEAAVRIANNGKTVFDHAELANLAYQQIPESDREAYRQIMPGKDMMTMVESRVKDLSLCI